MDAAEKKQLVMRNSEETVKEEELEEIIEEKENPRAYVGYETSGPVHLGHWVSVRKMLDIQEAGFQPVILWADLHTYLNKKGEEAWIQDMTDYWQATFEALGLDAEYVHGRDFQENDDYFHDLLTMMQKTTINRGERSMQHDLRDKEEVYVSQITYPLMQALDIVHLDLDLAVAGIEQRKIHMLAREQLPKLGYEKPTCLHWPMLSSLTGDGNEMSSSTKGSMFPLHSDHDHIREILKDAYCPQVEIEGNPIIEIAEHFIFGADRDLEVSRKEEHGGDLHYEKFEEMADEFESGELHPLDLKEAVAEEVVERFKPVRDKFRENPDLLEPLEEIGHETPEYIT